MMFLFPILIIGIGYYLLKEGKINLESKNNNSASNRLDERYINGEIDEETYKKMKKTIQS